MPSDRDVLGKADALLKRHAIAVTSDAGTVPMLTEFVDAPAPAPPTPPGPSGIASEVLQQVMADIESTLAAELERRLARHLAEQVDIAVAGALDELRPGIARAIEDALGAALERRNVK